MARMKAFGDALCQPVDLALFGLLGVLIVESGQDVLLVQPF
jgi:hypothetical protein